MHLHTSCFMLYATNYMNWLSLTINININIQPSVKLAISLPALQSTLSTAGYLVS